MAELYVSEAEYQICTALQSIFDVTVVSERGLIFMFRKDWQRLQTEIKNYSDFLWKAKESPDSPRLCEIVPDYINLVAYDKSEDYAYHAICHYEWFKVYCTELDIKHVLLPMYYDLVEFIREFDANESGGVLGMKRDWFSITVEDTL